LLRTAARLPDRLRPGITVTVHSIDDSGRSVD
jgi:hypothetical protein